MGYENPENMDLVGLLVGKKVVVEYMRGPDMTEEHMNRVIEQGEVIKDQPLARIAQFYLTAYGRYGIEVCKEPGHPAFFLPWSSVMTIYNLQSRKELVEATKEAQAREQAERTEEGNPT